MMVSTTAIIILSASNQADRDHKIRLTGACRILLKWKVVVSLVKNMRHLVYIRVSLTYLTLNNKTHRGSKPVKKQSTLRTPIQKGSSI